MLYCKNHDFPHDTRTCGLITPETTDAEDLISEHNRLKKPEKLNLNDVHREI